MPNPIIRMDKFVIEGGIPLKGEVEISGSKNASLPLMTASLLAEGRTILKNIPSLQDILFLKKVLEHMNVKIDYDEKNQIMQIDVPPKFGIKAPYEFVRKMRASVYVLGPMLARMKKAIVALPGGCAIGYRPIDLHIKGFKQLGAEIKIEKGYIYAHTKELIGSEFSLEGRSGTSVGATCNVMMAAVLSKGKTIIHGAAREPEVIELGNFLNKMGAKIKGLGTYTLEIEGVKKLKPITYKVISDRIEAGTFIVAGAITRGNIKIKNCIPEHLESVISKLKEAGLKLNVKNDFIEVQAENFEPSPLEITTAPYPGFPTDMQAQIMALLCFAKGVSTIKETIYPQRFMHVGELIRMGADIELTENIATIKGVTELSGAEIMASDLRASAALVLAALAAKGKSLIRRIYHIDRGYEKIEKKLQKLGAKIERIK